jgi:basic membrane lipoprotein Med (substrate-binding protein (PBP1-ABC) superfamily)
MKSTHLLRQSMVSALVLGTIVVGAAAPAAAAEVKKLAILVPEEPTDYGWNQQAFEAAKAIAAKYNLQFMPASGLGYGDVRPTLRELANDGASLMIAHASGYNRCRLQSSTSPQRASPEWSRTIQSAAMRALIWPAVLPPR